MMSPLPYTKGLVQIGQSSHAYLIPDGDWGASNCGLVIDGDQSLLVDTLFDLTMTAEMLRIMAEAHPAARRIDTLVNSHADGDHTFGNQLVSGARIIASRGTFEEFHNLGPQQLHAIIVNAERLGEGAQFIARHMGPDKFDFSNITLVEPNETYERELTLRVGDKQVALYNVGPAHTRGDTLVHVVEDRVVYTGDLLFIGVHPAIWDGSVEGWIGACDRILALDVDIVVPGHGPITDKRGVAEFRRYLVMLVEESSRRHAAGMTVEEAALDIVLGSPFANWVSPERIVGSVNFLFRNWGSPHATDSVLERFAMIGRYAKAKAAQRQDHCRHDHGG